MAVDPLQAWMLPLTAGWRASEAWWGVLGQGEAREPPAFATDNEIVLDLPTLRLRRFARGMPAARGGRRARAEAPRPPLPTVGPYALHHASIVDLAPGHSIVERLLAEGLPEVWVAEWRSATPAMAGFGIDSCLADLLVVVDDLGGRAALVGICQGGWLSLAFAARFAAKVASLVLAGAPVDYDAAPSFLVEAARATPPAVVDALVAAGGGRALSHHLLASWGIAALDEAGMKAILQSRGSPPAALADRLQAWNGWAVDLPGRYFTEVFEKLFRGNALATGHFTALGRTADLRAVLGPVCLLAGRRDAIAPPGQVLAVRHLVGTPAHDMLVLQADCDHLPLFLGRDSLAGAWARIARWLQGHEGPHA